MSDAYHIIIRRFEPTNLFVQNFVKLHGLWEILPINGKSRTLRSVSKLRNSGRFDPGSFRPESFRPIFGVGRFGHRRCVVSA